MKIRVSVRNIFKTIITYKTESLSFPSGSMSLGGGGAGVGQLPPAIFWRHGNFVQKVWFFK